MKGGVHFFALKNMKAIFLVEKINESKYIDVIEHIDELGDNLFRTAIYRKPIVYESDLHLRSK